MNGENENFKRVRLPDNRVVKFPSSMSNEDIAFAIQNNFPEFSIPKSQGKMGWPGVYEDIKSIPGKVGQFISQIPSEAEGIIEHPERIPGNILQVMAEAGRAPTAALPGLADYLASKEIISQETAQKVPLRPPSIENAFNVGNEKGDMLTQLISGGLITPGVPGGVTKGISKGAKIGATPFMPSTYVKNHLSPQELQRNFRAAEGTLTPLGSIIDSPFLKGLYENVASNIPLSGVDTATGKIAKQVGAKAEELLKKSEGALQPGDRNVQLKHALSDAYRVQRDIKSKLYEPVDQLAVKENFTLELPQFSNVAKEYTSLFESSPLSKTDKKFKITFNKFKNYEKPYLIEKYKTRTPDALAPTAKNISSNLMEAKTLGPDALIPAPKTTYSSLIGSKALGPNSLMPLPEVNLGKAKTIFPNLKEARPLGPDALISPPKKIYPSLVEAKSFVTELENAATEYKKSSDPHSRNIGSKYQQAARALRNDIANSIEKKASPELKEALRIADKNYAENFSKFLDEDVYKYLQSDKQIDDLVNKILQPGAISDKFSRLQKIQRLLPTDQKNLIGNAWLRRALDKEGDLNPKQFAQLINKLGKRQFETLFPDPVYRQELLDYGRLRGMNEKALSRMANPPTGQTGNLPKALWGQAAASAGALMTGHPLAAVAALIGPQIAGRALNKYLTSPTVRKKLIDKLIAESNKNVKHKD